MNMNTASSRISWRSLLIDNIFGIAFLLCVLFLTVAISAIGFLGYVLFLSGVPLVLVMIPLSFVALLASEQSLGIARWWFVASFIAWAVSPLIGGWLYPLLNSLGDQPVVVSDPGAFVVWTQWIWALPFLGLYALIGAFRMRKSRTNEIAGSPVVA